jgi:drug/metabolite transporter (DMT)-like permease
MFYIVLLYAVLASTFVFAKKALEIANPFFLIGIRMILAGVFLIAYQGVFRKDRFFLRKKDLWLFFKVSLFHIYLSYMFEFWSLQHLTALKTTIIYSATPFIGAILSYFLLSERLTKNKVFGICVGLSGIVPVIVAQSGAAEAAMELGCISLPEVVLFAAVVVGAYAWFIVKELIGRGYDLVMINGIAMLVGGVGAMVSAGFIEGFANPIQDFWPFLLWLSLLILSANVIVYNLYGWLIKRYTITFVMFAGFLSPSFGTLYEWLFFDGRISWHHFLSILLVAVGLYLFNKDELKNLALSKIK